MVPLYSNKFSLIVLILKINIFILQDWIPSLVIILIKNNYYKYKLNYN